MRCNPFRWLFLGLLLVPILTYFAVQHRHQHIEDDLRERSQQALASEGLSWAGTAYEGRNGRLSGRATEETERSRVNNIVRSVWGVYTLDNGTNLINKEDNYIWRAKLRPDGIRLSGFVPNEATRRSILGVVKANFPGQKVDDRLQLARGVPSRDVWMGAISYSLKQLAQLNGGRVALTGLDLSISGQARDFGSYRTVKTALKNRLPADITLKRDEVTPPQVSPYVWGAEFEGGQLVLSGHVPSEAARDRLFATAKKAFPKVRVVDRMETAVGQPKAWQDAVEIGLLKLAGLNRGSVKLSDSSMIFLGTAETELGSREIDNSLRGGLPRNFNSQRKIKFIQPAIKAVSPFVTSALVERDEVVLEGYYPSEAAHQALIAAAKTRFKNRRIVDRMVIGAGAPKSWENCAIIGLGALDRLGNGRLDLSDRSMVVVGSTQDEGLANSLAGEVRTATARRCESDVRVDFRAPPEPNLVWSATKDADNIVLAGEVPDAQTKTELVRRAKKMFPDAAVIDRMTVVGGRAVNWRKVAFSGLTMLARLRKGKVDIDAQQLNISGEAPDTSVVSAISNGISQDLPRGYRGTDRINVRSDAMIWAEQETKRKASLQVKLEAKRIEAKRLAALEAKRDTERRAIAQENEDRLRAEKAWKRAAEETRRRRQETARRQAEAERLRLLDIESARKAAQDRAQAEAARMEREAQEAQRLADRRRKLEERRQRLALERARLEKERRQARIAAEADEQRRRREAAAARVAMLALEAKREQEKLALRNTADQRRTSCQTSMGQIASEGTIRFKRAKATLSNVSNTTLEKIAEAAQACPGMKIEIGGHTDSDGSESLNQSLSERRAGAVRDFLIDAGVTADRLSAVGYGEEQPLVDNDSRKNKALNRRIEFNIKSN